MKALKNDEVEVYPENRPSVTVLIFQRNLILLKNWFNLKIGKVEKYRTCEGSVILYRTFNNWKFHAVRRSACYNLKKIQEYRTHGVPTPYLMKSGPVFLKMGVSGISQPHEKINYVSSDILEILCQTRSNSSLSSQLQSNWRNDKNFKFQSFSRFWRPVGSFLNSTC